MPYALIGGEYYFRTVFASYVNYSSLPADPAYQMRKGSHKAKAWNVILVAGLVSNSEMNDSKAGELGQRRAGILSLYSCGMFLYLASGLHSLENRTHSSRSYKFWSGQLECP